MDPGNMGPLGEWLPETIWPKLKSLERIKRFQNIGDAMQSDSDEWQVRLSTLFVWGTISANEEIAALPEGSLKCDSKPLLPTTPNLAHLGLYHFVYRHGSTTRKLTRPSSPEILRSH